MSLLVGLPDKCSNLGGSSMLETGSGYLAWDCSSDAWLSCLVCCTGRMTQISLVQQQGYI